LGPKEPTSYDEPVTLPAEFESYSRNGEDVVLWRALSGVEGGRYIDVGAYDPRIGSVSAAFYDRGWTGITVDPDPESGVLHRAQRPRDVHIEAAAIEGDQSGATLHVVDGTGFSTLDGAYAAKRARSGFRMHDIQVPARSMNSILDESGWAGHDVHFMSVSTEGSEMDVLCGIDLARWRPWVLTVETAVVVGEPSSRSDIAERVSSAGYRLCLFDGLSCFFAAEERGEELAARLSIPASVLDNFTTPAYRRCRVQATAIPGLLEDVALWRTQALSWWAEAMNHSEDEEWQKRYAGLAEEHETTLAELEGVYQSRSWRITAPLRMALAARSGTRPPS
jgi:FkbM family methyltransferase